MDFWYLLGFCSKQSVKEVVKESVCEPEEPLSFALPLSLAQVANENSHLIAEENVWHERAALRDTHTSCDPQH